MNTFSVFTRDVGYFLKKPMMIVTFIAVAFLPIIYSGFLIKGNWDPYGRLADLPVAIVNLDQGAEYQGKSMTIGNEFEDELKKNESFKWTFVNEEDARIGMANNEYYATITIPANFSQQAASLSTDVPHQAEIIFESNSYYNFVAGQLSESATKELRNNLSANLTEAYTRSIFTQLGELSSGLNEAGAGATSLSTGATQLSEGMLKLKSNLTQLTSGATQLDTSVDLLEAGALKLSDGTSQLKSGATKLSSGSKELAAASSKLELGAAQTVQGSASLVSGLEASTKGLTSLTTAVQSLVKGAGQLESGLKSSVAASGELATGSAQVATGLKQLIASDAALESNSELQKLLAASQAVSQGAKDLNNGQQKLLDGSQSLVQGQEEIVTGSKKLSAAQEQILLGATQLEAGPKQLEQGLKQYNSKFSSLVTGIDNLVAGSNLVDQGASQLKSGLGKLATGTGSLASGAKQFDAGTDQLRSGSDELAVGAGQLADKLNEAATSTASFKADDQIIQLISQPVIIKTNDDRKVNLYANGIAPYFLSLAFLAGALVFTTTFSTRDSSVEGASGFRLFVSKLLTFTIMSLLQSLIVSTITLFVLGVKVQSIPLFYLYTVIVGFTFMFMVQMLVTWLDKPGQFLALILMIFQLVSSAGTFPVELLPNWAQVMNPLLPMTYSVRGYRDVISSGAYGDMWKEAAYLAAYIMVFVSLILLYFLTKHKKSTRERLIPIEG